MVALTVFRVPAWACLLCFTSYNERLRVCQTFAGLEGPELEKCEEAFLAAFKGLLDTEISEETTPPSSRALGGACRGRGQGGLERPCRRETHRQIDRDSKGQRLRDGRIETAGPLGGVGGKLREGERLGGADSRDTGG